MFTILTKSNCVWCDKAKELLTQKGATFVAHDFREHPVILLLLKKARLDTVPQIWHQTPEGREYIGGFSDLEHYFKEQEEKHDRIPEV